MPIYVRSISDKRILPVLRQEKYERFESGHLKVIQCIGEQVMTDSMGNAPVSNLKV